MIEIVRRAFMGGFTRGVHSALMIKEAAFCPYKQIQV